MAQANDLEKLNKKPNVLFISVDDLNDWVGVLGGHPQAKTPNIDRLASQGLLFTQAHTPSPACNPARAAVLTGVPTHQSGVYDNNHDWRAALPNAVTIPQLFKKNGYWVGGGGKIYHWLFPEAEGWDEFHPRIDMWRGPFVNRAKPGKFGWSPRPKNRPVSGIPDPDGQFDWGPLDVDPEEMHEAKVAAWVTEKLRTDYDRPFFLACGLFLPHLPMYAPQKYFDAFPLDQIQLPQIQADDLDDVPPLGVELANPAGDHAKVMKYDQYRQAVQAYLASTYFADDMLGRILDALAASSYADNTVVVLWSDHGWHLGEKLHWQKNTLWDEATRIPLIISAPKGTVGLPGGVKPGSVCDRPVNLLDLYQTLIDLAQLESAADITSRSLLPLLQKPDLAWNYPAISIWHQHASARSERFRLIRYEDGSEEFYDHQGDSNEWNNLAQDPKYREFKQSLARWLPTTFAPAAPEGRTTKTRVPWGY